jgi:uncharacterized protein YcgI (DUF1989 family)
MAEQQTQTPALYAEITGRAERTTTARLVIFDKQIEKMFAGTGDDADGHDAACTWCNAWNAHLDKEWMGVRETFALIMQDFTEALRKNGVSEQAIASAMKEVQVHAKG